MNCDIIKRFIELLGEADPGFSDAVASSIERQLRQEYAGERIYIPKHDKNVSVLIVEQFNGKNTDKIAHELRISRRTVYRSIHKARKGRQNV